MNSTHENPLKRHWMLAIVALAAIIMLGVLFSSVLRAYAKSHCAYLTSVPAAAPQVEFR
jgi:hypothetical protein